MKFKIRKISTYLFDYGCMLRGLASMLFYRNPTRVNDCTKNGKIGSVIILPGISLTWGFYMSLIEKLQNDFQVFVIPELGHGFRKISEMAGIMNRFIEDNKIEDAVIVGHSKGGLVGKYYLARHNQDGKILGLVSIATPFFGTPFVKLFRHNAYRELVPESQEIADLNRCEDVNGKIVCVMPLFDNQIPDEYNMPLKGAENMQTTIAGHHRILFNEEGQRFVMESVRKFINKK